MYATRTASRTTPRRASGSTAGSATRSVVAAAARGVALLSTGLLAGSALANYLLESSLSGSLAFAIEYKQLVIVAFTVALTVLGVSGAVSLAATAFLRRHDRIAVWTAVLAAVCLVVGVVITVTVHFPINAQVMTWVPTAPPADAAALLARWTVANAARTVTAIGAFVLVLVPSVGIRSARS